MEFLLLWWDNLDDALCATRHLAPKILGFLLAFALFALTGFALLLAPLPAAGQGLTVVSTLSETPETATSRVQKAVATLARGRTSEWSLEPAACTPQELGSRLAATRRTVVLTTPDCLAGLDLSKAGYVSRNVGESVHLFQLTTRPIAQAPRVPPSAARAR